MARNLSPGYCVVEQPGSLLFQTELLFRNRNSSAARHFQQLNADTPWVKPGQILVVADPDCTITAQMLRTLRQAKQQVNNDLISISGDEASFFQRHYGIIAGLTSAGNKIFGAAGDAGEKYFTAIEEILKKIELTYQNQFRTQGTLIGQQFFVERNRLFAELKELVNKPLLKALARYSVKFRPYDDMRRALNLSSRSIAYEWSAIGVGAIPGYATYTANAARAAKYMKYGGYIGIGFSLAGTTNNVVLACTAGRENECGRVAVREYSKFGESTVGSAGGGVAGASVTAGICVAIGITTAGTGALPCAIIGGLAGGFAGGLAGELISEKFLDHIGY